jgi:hypothetical protein
MHRFLDSVSLSGVRITDEGYLIADAFAVRTGIQRYLGSEVGRPDLPFVDVYRPPEEVFSKDSLHSFSHIPITNDHPKEAVTAANWKDLALGEVSTDVLRDGEKLRIPLIVKDASGVADVQNGKRELSAGYSCSLDWENGTTSDGRPYQAIQRTIRANHLAIVKCGRAGSEFRIGDSADANHWGAAPIIADRETPPMNMRTVFVDGIPVSCTDQGAAAIEKLNKDKAQLTADNLALTTRHTTELAAKDAEIGALKADLKKAQDSVPSGVMLDKLVADRAGLVDLARRLHKDVKLDGLTDAEIRRTVVSARLGPDFAKDASDAEIGGMFKALAKDVGTVDPVRQTLLAGDHQQQPQVGDNGYGAYVARVSDAWKGTPQQAAR